MKSNGENGNREAIPAIDSVDEPNGDAQGPADTTAETIPANGSVAETKVQSLYISFTCLKLSNILRYYVYIIEKDESH